jgi:hypothetical protein
MNSCGASSGVMICFLKPRLTSVRHKSLQAQASGKKLNATTNACDGSDSSCYIRSRFPQHRCIMTLRDFVRPCIFTPQRTLHENTQLLLTIFSL